MSMPGEKLRKGTSSPIRYPDAGSRSAEIFRKAQRVLADCGSRSTIRVAPYSIYVANAQGKYVTDVDGNMLLDLNYNYTSMIHGHSHQAIVAAVQEQLQKGTGFSFGSEAELALAELLCDRCDNFDKIRFMNSGTEAVMNAIKATRAYTGKPKIAKCENAYHGSYDFAEVSLGVEPTDLAAGDPVSRAYSAGTPQRVLDDVIVIPFNDVSNARRILDEHADDLAAILFDPFGANLARVPPSDEFLAMLQAFRDQHDVLLIADEVISFRAGCSGVQGDRGFRPDLTTLGKIIGGGFPVGAVAGSQAVMSVFESDESRAKVPHGGTYNANPITMVAGYTAMQMLTEDAFGKLNALGTAFRKGIQEVLDLTGTEGSADGQYSIFAISTRDPDLEEAAPRGQVFKSGGLHQYMVQNGYWLTPGMVGVLCTLMDTADIDPFCETLKNGINELKGRN